MSVKGKQIDENLLPHISWWKKEWKEAVYELNEMRFVGDLNETKICCGKVNTILSWILFFGGGGEKFKYSSEIKMIQFMQKSGF